MPTNAQKTDTPEPKPLTKRQMVLNIPIASEAYGFIRKQGIRYDAERTGLSRAGVGTNDAEMASMRRDIPRNWTGEIDEGLASLRHGNFRAVDKEAVENELAKSGKSISDLEPELDAEKEGLAVIDVAFASFEESEILLDSTLDIMAEGGQVDLSSVLRGGHDLIMPERNQQISVLGKAVSVSVQGEGAKAKEVRADLPVFCSASVPIANYGILLRYSPTIRAEMKAGLLAEAIKAVGDGTRIPIADRDRLRAEAAQRILHKRRLLEAAIVEAEFEGKRPHRPADTPWHILLWVEPDPTKPALQVVADNTDRRTQNPDGTTSGEAREIPPLRGQAEPSKKKRTVTPSLGEEPTWTDSEKQKETWES